MKVLNHPSTEIKLLPIAIVAVCVTVVFSLWVPIAQKHLDHVPTSDACISNSPDTFTFHLHNIANLRQYLHPYGGCYGPEIYKLYL